MQIAVSNLIRAGYEEGVRGANRWRLLEDLRGSGGLEVILPEDLPKLAWAADSSESSRDALWATILAAYRRPGGTPWGAVILELTRPVLIPALERLDDQGLLDDHANAVDPQPSRATAVVPSRGLERPGGYALLDNEDVAQQVLVELLAIASTCRVPAPARWTPHRLTTQTIRQVRRWLRSQVTPEGIVTSLEVAVEPGDSEQLTPRAVVRALMERGLSADDAELIYRARILRIPIRALAQSSGVTFGALKRRHSRAREKLRQFAAAA